MLCDNISKNPCCTKSLTAVSCASREAQEIVERMFLLTQWCPTAPGLAVVIPFPLKKKSEAQASSTTPEPKPQQAPPKKSARLTNQVTYKLWLIRLTQPQPLVWCAKRINNTQVYEKIDDWKFSVNLSKINEENSLSYTGTQSAEEIAFLKEGIFRGLKISWHPNLLELYLVYNSKATTIFPVKKALSDENLRQRIQLNPASFPSPLKLRNGQMGSAELQSPPFNSTLFSIGVSVGNSLLKLSTINTVSCIPPSPPGNSEKLVLPHSLYWLFDKNICPQVSLNHGSFSGFPGFVSTVAAE